MDSFNLKTASTYVNNLLLARGLLRNGKPVEFARPHKGEGGTEATMAQIINIVHDMILRKDREQEQREALAQTVRDLRTESNQKSLDLERLQTKYDDLARQLSLAQSQERSARAASRTAESSAKALREELARLKTTVQQIRMACANDVRKRDIQIQKLKSHLTSQQRGTRGAPVGATIVIHPGSTIGSMSSRDDEGPAVDDPEYSLKQETTEFLTQLSQSLSDENDNLIGLVRSTLSTLRELQGLPENVERAGSAMQVQQNDDQDNMVQPIPTSYDSLAADMDEILENLRNLLTNPNFVSIEEVSIRDDEIQKLRSGWEKMEGKWKEAMVMMDGWRKRMKDGGDTVNIEDIKRALGLGQQLQITDPMLSQSVMAPMEDDDTSEELDYASELQSEDDESITQSSIAPSVKSDRHRFPQPLIEANGNGRSPRKVAFKPDNRLRSTSAADENESDMDGRNLGKSPRSTKASSSPNKQLSSRESRLPRKSTLKRSSSPGPHPSERSPKLTVQEKLNVAQAEAEAAAVAAGLRLDDIEVGSEGRNSQYPRNGDVTRSNSRKTRMSGRPRRRKSTLTPHELEQLMFV